MAYADFDDVGIYVPDLSDDDANKVAVLLEQAEDLVRLEYPDLDARISDGRTPIIRIQRVEGEMVAAVMNNPRARQSESQTVGGLSVSHTVDTKVASGLLQLTDRHRALIEGLAVGTASSGAAFTIRPGGRH